MSQSPKDARRGLPVKLLALPLAAALVWLLPYRDIATNFETWFLAPLWIALGHVLTAGAYVVTSLRLRPAWFLLLESVKVYASLASASHLAAAFLIALAEESVFRFALLPWLADLGGSNLAAVAVTSALFSVLHIKHRSRRSFLSHLDFFLFAAVLGALTLLTRSLLPAVLLHTTRNYILRCMLVSKRDFDAMHRSARGH